MHIHRRLSALLFFLARHRHSAAELAAAMGVSLRTVYRDIERLRKEGYAVEGVSGPGGGFWLADCCAPAPLSLGLDEVREVLFALHGAGALDHDLEGRCTHKLSRGGSCSLSTTPPSPFEVDITGAGPSAWCIAPTVGAWSSSPSGTRSAPV